MSNLEIMVYACFGLWALGTALVFGLQILRPQKFTREFSPVLNIRHHIMMFTVMSWLSMWAFVIMRSC